MIDRPYLTAAEVARELGVSLRTVRRWVADGRLAATRVGRSVRIRADGYREVVAESLGGASPGSDRRPRASGRIGELAAGYTPGPVAQGWPDSAARLAEQRRNAAALMDRLAAQGRPAAGPSETADAILDAVREDLGASGDRRSPAATLGSLPAEPRTKPPNR